MTQWRKYARLINLAESSAPNKSECMPRVRPIFVQSHKNGKINDSTTKMVQHTHTHTWRDRSGWFIGKCPVEWCWNDPNIEFCHKFLNTFDWMSMLNAYRSSFALEILHIKCALAESKIAMNIGMCNLTGIVVRARWQISLSCEIVKETHLINLLSINR